MRQHTHCSVSLYIQRLLPMTGMVMLHQVSFIFSFFSTLFFYIIIHLNTTVLETNIVTYLNIVRTIKTNNSFYRKGRKLIMSFSHNVCRCMTLADCRQQTADCRPQIADCKLKDTKNLPNKGDRIRIPALFHRQTYTRV